MGKLYDPSLRSYFKFDNGDVKSHCEDIKKIAKDTGLSVTEVIEVHKLLIRERYIDCYVNTNDLHDEVMSGLGELLKSLNSTIEDGFEALSPKSEED